MIHSPSYTCTCKMCPSARRKVAVKRFCPSGVRHIESQLARSPVSRRRRETGEMGPVRNVAEERRTEPGDVA